MTAARTCPKCGAELPGDDLGGLCPKCLGAVVFGIPAEAAGQRADAGSQKAEGSGQKSEIRDQRSELRLPQSIRYFGDYELLEEIAHGGMGVVYKARQVSLNRIVAVKLILSGPFATEEFIKRFRAEAEAAASLQHPNIVAIHEVGEHEGQHYFSMDHVEGQSLAALLRDGPLSGARAARYVQLVAEAIHYAHQHGILHRDLKPSNVLIDAADQPRITDFGLAKRLTSDTQLSTLNSELTVSGQVLGSPGYLAPEQATGHRGEVGPPTDIYGLGAMLYCLLTGRAPFQGDTVTDVLVQVLNRGPVAPRLLNPSIPKDLETICLKCLEKGISQRYASAQALADELGRFLQDKPIQARPVGRPEKVWRWCRRNPRLAGLSAAVTLLVVFVLIAAPLVALHQARLRRMADKNAQQAREQENRADQEARQAEAALYRTRLSENRALRLARPQGWSELTFQNLRSNLVMNLPQRDLVELRSEAVASMEEIDVREIARLVGHTWAVWSLDFSADGAILGSADYKGATRLWEIATKQVRSEIKDPAAWSSQPYTQLSPWPAIRFSPRGDDFAYSTWSHSVEVIPIRNPGAAILRVTSPEQAQYLGFDRKGDLLAVAWSNGRGIVYETVTGKALREFRQPRGTALLKEVVAISPQGTTLALIGTNNAIELHNLAGDDTPLVLEPHPETVYSLCFDPEGSRLVAAFGHFARIYDVKGATEQVTLRGHKARVLSAVFRNDGRLVATGSDDQTARLWNPRTGQTVLTVRPEMGSLFVVAFSPGGHYLAVASEQVVVYRLTNEGAKQILAEHTWVVSGLAFHPLEPVLASVSWAGPAILWDLPSGQSKKRLPSHPAGFANTADGYAHNIAFSPDGKLIAVGHKSYPTFNFSDHGLHVWEVGSGALHRSFESHRSEVNCVAFDPSGKLLASGDLKGAAIVRDILGGKLERRWQQPGDAVIGLEFLNPGYSLLIAHASGQIRICDCLTGKIIAQGTAPGALTNLAVSPTQKQLALTSHSGAIHLLALPTFTLTATLDHAHGQGSSAVAFGRDGRILASGGADRQVILWDALTGRRLLRLPPQESPVLNLAFEPAGFRLAICGVEELVTIWNLRVVRERLAGLGLDWDWPLADTPRMRADWPQTLAQSFLRQTNGLSTNGLAMAWLARLLAQQPKENPQQFAVAQSLSRTAIDVTPYEPDVWLIRAEILESQGDGSEALAVLQQAAEQYLQNPLIEKARGAFLEKANRLAGACQAFAKAIELASANTNAYGAVLNQLLLDRSSLLRRLGQLSDAGLDNCRARKIPLRDPRAGPNLVDLSPFYNKSLNEDLLDGAGRNLAALPPGLQRLGQVDFDLRGLVHLTWAHVSTPYPASVSGVPVNRKCDRMHFLHGTAWFDAAGTKIGAYVLHYSDGGQVEFPIVYEEDVRDWWCRNVGESLSRATLAWTGEKPDIKASRGFPRLYRRTWENPRPDVEVKTIDFVSTMSNCGPFLVALTVE